jgi:NitT/TauT family transport system substrate-binding protein
LAASIGLAAGGEKTARASSPGGRPAADKTLRVAIATGESAFISLADGMGYFKEMGVKYEFHNMQDPNQALNAIALGKLDVNTVALVPTLSQIAQGAELTIFGGVRSEGGEIIAKAQNRGRFTDITSLRGAKVAVIHLDTADYNTRKLLREKGVNPDTDVEYVEVDSYMSVTEAVKKGTVDYGISISEMARLAERQGLVSVQKVADLAPSYVCCRQVAPTADVKANRRTYVNYLKAQIKGYKFFKDNQRETAEFLSRLTGQPADYYATNVYGKDAPLFSPEPAAKKVRDFYELLKAEGVLKTDVDINAHIDSTLFRDAIREIRAESPDDPAYETLYAEFTANN